MELKILVYYYKTRKDKVSHYIGTRVVLSKAYLSHPQDKKGSGSEPKMTDPVPPNIPHCFSLRTSLGLKYS